MLRSFRSFIKKRADLAKSIKDLKDLRALRVTECYRHSGPTDLKRKEIRFFRSANDGEGQGFPPPYDGGGFLPPRPRVLHRDQEVSPTGTSLVSRPGGRAHTDL